jgi:phosphoribosylformylglycinamidine synthase|tara:strand:- start:638 stop:898 length:261 start_codon:yes stop_codon:yes gene_type:complete
MKFKAKVFIRLRENVSDAAGNAVRANVARVADIRECSKLRLGKCIDIEFEAPNTDHARRELAKASDLLFANTVVEDWSYELLEVDE